MSIPEAFRLNLTDALGIASGSTAAEIVRRADLLRRATRGLPQGDGAPPSADAFHRVEVTSDGGARHWVRSAGEEDWRPVSREEFDDSFDPHGAKVEVGPRPPVAQPYHLSYVSAAGALEQIAVMIGIPKTSTSATIAATVHSTLQAKDSSIEEIVKTADARWELNRNTAAAMGMPNTATPSEIVARAEDLCREEVPGVKGTWFDSVEHRLGLLEESMPGVVCCGPPGSDEEKIRQLKDELMSMHERRRGLIAERDHALSDVRRLQGAVTRLTDMGEGLLYRADHFEGRCNGASNEADGRSFSDILSRARACDTLRLEAEARLWTAIRGYGYSLGGTECKREEEAAEVTAAMDELVAASRRNPLSHDAVSAPPVSTCTLSTTMCPRHGFIHGGEAAELRDGIERLIEEWGPSGDGEGASLSKAMRKLLDDVDARDSCAVSEAAAVTAEPVGRAEFHADSTAFFSGVAVPSPPDGDVVACHICGATATELRSLCGTWTTSLRQLPTGFLGPICDGCDSDCKDDNGLWRMERIEMARKAMQRTRIAMAESEKADG